MVGARRFFNHGTCVEEYPQGLYTALLLGYTKWNIRTFEPQTQAVLEQRDREQERGGGGGADLVCCCHPLVDRILCISRMHTGGQQDASRLPAECKQESKQEFTGNSNIQQDKCINQQETARATTLAAGLRQDKQVNTTTAG